MDFKRIKINKTLFIKRIKSDILLVQVYVDDIIFGSTKKELCTDLEKLMHKKFQMSSMGELTFFLGLQVTQKDDGIFISHDKYVDDILKKFGFSTVKTANTAMKTSKPLLKDAEAEDVNVHLYRSMIGSLMYLTAFRPNIMFVVCACARFQVTPKVSHLHAVKRIFRYLKGQPKLGLWYPKDSPFDLEAYTDSDYRCMINWKIHNRYALTKNPTIISPHESFGRLLTSKPVKMETQEITATVDGKEFTITKASVRRHIQLADVDGISVLPTPENFAHLSLMGYASTDDKTNTSEPIPNVADKAVYEEWDDRVERATTTAVSLDAGQASGNINKTQSTSMSNVPLPQELMQVVVPGAKNPWGVPLLRISLRGVLALETNLRQTKKVYGAAYTKLIMKVKKLEKTVKSNQARRRAKIVSSQKDQPKDQLGVLSAAKKNVNTYTRRRRAVSTGSGGVSTASRLFSTAKESVSIAGASMPVSTAGMVQEVNISIPSPVVVKDKGKGIMTESEDEQTKRTKIQLEQERLGHEAAVRLQEELDEEERQRMARFHEAAQSFTEEE
ncbi:putative ribonuclease H-like domain-containing protein [Tanacetum coccineum]